MKKNVQIAFAIVLFMLAIVGSVWKIDYFANIIYAVVIPSFILSVISFMEEISIKCGKDAESSSDLHNRLADAINKSADLEMELYNNGVSELPFVEGKVPEKIYKLREEALDSLKNSVASTNVNVFCLKLSRMCNNATTIGYVLLFLVLIFSPYVVEILDQLDLNCITLWSLALLYITLELKEEICARLYNYLYNLYKKRQKE